MCGVPREVFPRCAPQSVPCFVIRDRCVMRSLNLRPRFGKSQGRAGGSPSERCPVAQEGRARPFQRVVPGCRKPFVGTTAECRVRPVTRVASCMPVPDARFPGPGSVVPCSLLLVPGSVGPGVVKGCLVRGALVAECGSLVLVFSSWSGLPWPVLALACLPCLSVLLGLFLSVLCLSVYIPASGWIGLDVVKTLAH